jgi:hypothetical protein
VWLDTQFAKQLQQRSSSPFHPAQGDWLTAVSVFNAIKATAEEISTASSRP